VEDVHLEERALRHQAAPRQHRQGGREKRVGHALGGDEWRIIWADFTEAELKGKTARQVVQRRRATLVAGLGGTHVRDRELKVGEHPGHDLELRKEVRGFGAIHIKDIEPAIAVSRFRLYLVNKRLYQLGRTNLWASPAKEKPPSKYTEQFLGSFEPAK
jgi:hypothetical protein